MYNRKKRHGAESLPRPTTIAPREGSNYTYIMGVVVKHTGNGKLLQWKAPREEQGS